MTDPNKPTTIIESNKRLSESILWQWQRHYFSRTGITAWSSNTVPHYITNNRYIAGAYAAIVTGWIRDMYSSLDQSQPLYIVELGAGSGRLAYHFLTIFFDLLKTLPFRDLPITYVMTDFTEASLNFWLAHPQLTQYVTSGQLDFALFDAEHDEVLYLINQGIELSSDTVTNPMVFIANYFFDGLTQDAFWIDDDGFHEALITLTVDDDVSDSDDPALLKQVKDSYSHREATTDYYADPNFNAVLADYEAALNESYVLFPIGSLTCIQLLLDICGGNAMLIAGDKGYHHGAELIEREEPALTEHGSFSMMVNFNAIGRYTRFKGGKFLSTSYRHARLDICVSLFGDHAQNAPETQYAYQREIVHRNPDDFFIIKQFVDSKYGNLKLEDIIAMIRLSGWDSTVFKNYLPVMQSQLDNIIATERAEVYRCLDQVWKGYYFIGEETDLPFMLSTVLYEIELFQQAIEFLGYSLEMHGDDANTYCNLAMCHFQLDQFETALEFVNQSLELNPTVESAQALKQQIDDKL